MPPMDADQIRQYLEFYQDLHIQTLYRRSAPATKSAAVAAVKAPSVIAPPAPVIAAAEPKMELPPLAPPDDSLFNIMQDIGDCRRCRLSEARNKIVFGVGDEKAPLVFVGEGPGADEDAQGD